MREAQSLRDRLQDVRIHCFHELSLTSPHKVGYSPDGSRLEENIARLIEVGASGLNIEDSVGAPEAPQFPADVPAKRVAAVRSAAEKARVPLVVNARVDTLPGGREWGEAMSRANACLAAGADVVSFGPGLLGLTLSRLQAAATTLTALGDHPQELGFSY